MLSSADLIKRWAWGLGLPLAFLFLAWTLETLATLLLLSFLLAYVLNPIATRLDKLRFINRTAATTITLIGLIVAFSMMMFVVIPDVIDEVRSFVARLPFILEQLQTRWVPRLEDLLNITIPLSIADAVDQFGRDFESVAPQVIGHMGSVVSHIFGGTASVVTSAVSVFMFPLFLFFQLKDYPRILETIDNLIPLDHKMRAHALGREIDEGLSAFLHGQFTVMLILGTLYAIGYSIVGIPVAIGAGLITGLLCFIPYLGPAAGFVLALILGILHSNGIAPVVGVVIVFVTVQVFDGMFITPRILGGKLGLRPLWIIIALMAGAELFGFMGVLLAVPTTAVLKVLVRHSVAHYKHSSVYMESHHHEPDSQAPHKKSAP